MILVLLLDSRPRRFSRLPAVRYILYPACPPPNPAMPPPRPPHIIVDNVVARPLFQTIFVKCCNVQRARSDGPDMYAYALEETATPTLRNARDKIILHQEEYRGRKFIRGGGGGGELRRAGTVGSRYTRTRGASDRSHIADDITTTLQRCLL